MVEIAQKNPVKQRAGAIGAKARWGARRRVKLADLSPEVAAAVRALIDADAASKAARNAASLGNGQS